MSVNKVQLANGETIIDISDSTVTPETLAEGVTAHDASGQKITGKMVQGGGKSVQSDWNQTDETAADFIKNKPFAYKTIRAVFPEMELVGEESDGVFCTAIPENITLDEAKIISVTFDGVEYVCDYVEDGYYGNGILLGAEDTGEPFCIVPVYGLMAFMDAEPHRISITTFEIVKMPDEYYNAAITYFINYIDMNDVYLYKDQSLTTKVTLEDLQNLPPKSVIIRYAYNNNALSLVCMYAVYIIGDDAVSGGITVYNGSSFTKYRPAEYVPETTT